MPRRKALIIGINYTGTSHALNGCVNDAMNVRDFLVRDRGFSPNPGDMVLMTDEPQNRGTPFEPTGHNILAAFQWLVSANNDGDSVWISYSGHGGQVKDPDGDRDSGFDDTICPVDFERNGQITSDTLHKTLVSPMNPRARLTVLFDCCHSGSAIELPYVYRPDSAGNVNLVDTVKQGMGLISAASHLLQGGFSTSKLRDAEILLGGAKTFFNSLQHKGQPQGETTEDGLGEEHFVEDWKGERKDAWMFSGCADDQTSADTSIAGAATGAMSYAFIKTMRQNPRQTYLEVLQSTRQELASKYAQIPQLSCGGPYDLDVPVTI